MNTNRTDWRRGWEEHKRQQILAIARETTPLHRLQWLEEMLQLLWRSGLTKHTSAQERNHENE
ncbi:MAG: hypothetical protein IH851_02120 [Armatimonadetes bacterium]|nr:hypothetical protein [Armatimonadota bacterium]